MLNFCSQYFLSSLYGSIVFFVRLFKNSFDISIQVKWLKIVLPQKVRIKRKT